MRGDREQKFVKPAGLDFLGPGGGWDGPPVAVFWDQSLLWGLICLESLEQLDVPFCLLSGEEVARGALDGYRVLVVPGGWASHKMAALGEGGKVRLRRFVEEGGSYLGFCGGAGLALSSPPSLGLVPLERMTLAERLPSASGEVWVEGVPDHPIWENLPAVLPVSIWWPSQFALKEAAESLCLAVYKAPGADFQVADIALSDVGERQVAWSKWERQYGINLDPAKLMGHPAIVEARRGKGRLILSYAHLDTPGQVWGNRLFLCCLRYLDGMAAQVRKAIPVVGSRPGGATARAGVEALSCLREARDAAAALISFGEQHLLWNWRRPWLLNWRRGIRGLEYGTLLVVLTRLLDRMEQESAESPPVDDQWCQAAHQIREETASFCTLARSLLAEEKRIIRTGNLTKLGRVNAAVDRLRGELFGDRMNHGGLCRQLFDRLDQFLLQVLRGRVKG